MIIITKEMHEIIIGFKEIIKVYERIEKWYS